MIQTVLSLEDFLSELTRKHIFLVENADLWSVGAPIPASLKAAREHWKPVLQAMQDQSDYRVCPAWRDHWRYWHENECMACKLLSGWID